MAITVAEEARIQEQKRLEQEQERLQEEEKRVQEEAIREAARLLEAYPENLQQLPSELTGVEVQVQEIIGKLDDVRILCLTGMGGSGKTTLAMVVFNQLCRKFEYTCFIHNIKLIRGSMDVAEDAIMERLHQGGKRVQGRYSLSSFRGKKVLCVLDNISDRENNNLSHLAGVVALESRFIVTCRQEGLLKISNTVVHKVKFLNEDSSKLLLMKCVFPEKKVPPVEFEELFGAIVKKCEGLPLTLEVLGKYLENDQSFESWEQTLNALEKAEDVTELNDRLWAKLRLSYDGLGQIEQQMFLDATTFFSSNKHWTLREAKLAWRVAYKTRSEGLQWKSLVDRSLVYYVEEYDCIKVHEQLQSLGRKIASEPSSYGEYRVWGGEAGVKMLQNITNELDGKEIHALHLDKVESNDSHEDDEAIHIARTVLQNLKKLQFLEARVPIIIDGAMDVGSFPMRLVLLSCVGHHSLFDPAFQTQLAVLKLHHLDYLPDSISQLSSLKYLEIIGCDNLCFAPEFFNKLSSLRLLKLESCQGFQSLPESVKHLSALQRLEFSFCKALCTLSETFGHLSSLGNLKFDSCPAFHTLPESFGQLSSLMYLRFYRCRALHTLPESFGQLSSLSHLQFRTCESLHTLPETFGQLSSLIHLEFMKCDALCTLPESFGQLPSLKDLQFSSCHALQTLSESFGQLSSLTNLKFIQCDAFHTLPKSFGQLSSLSHLEFTHCGALHTLPESFGQLSSLSSLQFYSCLALHSLPESFGQLSSLSYLRFSSCRALESLPESFGQLLSLSQLEFILCDALHTLPESIGHLSSLCHLEFFDCDVLHTLPESFRQLSSLCYLSFLNTEAWHTLPTSFGQLVQLPVSPSGEARWVTSRIWVA